jgi:hypothetical protein
VAPPSTSRVALVPRQRFLSALRKACKQRKGFAAGKLGESEIAWLQYPIALKHERDRRRLTAFELVMSYRSLRAAGVFPAEPRFYVRWCDEYAAHVRKLDSIGIKMEAAEATLALLRYHRVGSSLAIDFKDQQPDRSSPSAPSRCYLDYFAGRDLLLICPFAQFLAERATKTTFERVWAKTGKRWFAPRSVQAVEFAYGFGAATRARYGTSFDLLAEIQREVARRDFDVALIAAGGLAIPLATFVKDQGRVAISLGGHLQVLFGVQGERWRTNPRWRERYVNEAWVDLPERYLPKGDSSENYW